MSNHDMRCGHCNRTWNDKETPTPAGRCPYEYDHVHDEDNHLNDWYGVVRGVKFKSHGSVSDPGLIYSGREFNYWDIEDGVYELYRDHLREEYAGDEYLETIDYDPGADENDSHFTDWLASNVELIHSYLDDCIAGGYFNEKGI